MAAMKPAELRGKYKDMLTPSLDMRTEIEIAVQALKYIARVGCMQNVNEEEFFCKHDGSAHSCYCPAGIALEALEAIEGVKAWDQQ
jgi:hypothetical protein